MINQIYERFCNLAKEQYSGEEFMKITGMLFVAMQQELSGGEASTGEEDFGEFCKEEQNKLWTKAFTICNSYAEALQYLRTVDLEPADIEAGIKQVGDAQKNELFANFLIMERTNPKPVEKPQFMQGNQIKPFGSKVVQIEISEKDTLSMKIHIENYLKIRVLHHLGTRLATDSMKKRVTVHLVKEIPNYREFWMDKDQTPDGSGITKPLPHFLFGEYMDAVGHQENNVFVRQYLFDTRMTLENREELLKQFRSNSTN